MTDLEGSSQGLSCYNVFHSMNVSENPDLPAEKIAQWFRMLGQPARLRILLALGYREACVCHLEAWLGYRQAYISQQLMLLRDAGLVTNQRAGKHIFYALAVDAQHLANLIQAATRMAGYPEREPLITAPAALFPNCPCPHCNPEQSEWVQEAEPDRSDDPYPTQ